MNDFMKLSQFFMDELPDNSPWYGNIKGLVERLIAAGVTFKTKPKTQIDRIRAMNDKEFVEWLGKYILATLDCSGIEHDGFNDGEQEKLLKLLQRPLEEL